MATKLSSPLITKANRHVTINPPKMCQPIGAMYATLGIDKAVPLVQGSQGCCTYVRYQFNRHFKEPVNIAVTSFHEDAAVFGGRRNLIEGIRNLIFRYAPKVIGVVTTCSSETIGDDIEAFIKEAYKKVREELGDEVAQSVFVVPIHTPSYAGTHVKGYDTATISYIKYFAKSKEPNQKLYIIPGMINPGDIEEVKYLLNLMGIEYSVLFDISKTLNSPLMPPKPLYPEGGTPWQELEDCANGKAVLALCPHAGGSGASYLESEFGVKSILGPFPVGVENTDKFIENVALVCGIEIPEEVKVERGLLLDAMADTCQYTMMRRAAVFGDPDIVIAVTRFLCELGMDVKVVETATPSPTFADEIKKIFDEYNIEGEILVDSDLYEFEYLAKEAGVEVILGNSKAVEVAKSVKCPVVRIGFPVYDRVGYFRYGITGYKGSIWLLDLIVNTILDYSYPHDKLHQ
ncbi:Nitrogenase [Caldicellulosiruptor hydrothermalis 108]|uniref:Nitrogenase n=1 Tax=Caldicellulosiruptor hydrothermalis (strain DSM 18901 / VKM B-2411 / 108) TaxID=632292 RepID=E4Q7K2_CALH1|nr:nitrogenase component 1 [Caldicellulosiruptor hydrothermalis]ADQ07847.1 Nitrogenase [Caldicellulosiruptor hydrothermalis 108]